MISHRMPRLSLRQRKYFLQDWCLDLLSVHLYGKFNKKKYRQILSFSLTGDERTDEQTDGQNAIINMSLVMRKPAFCICESAADQRLCFAT